MVVEFKEISTDRLEYKYKDMDYGNEMTIVYNLSEQGLYIGRYNGMYPYANWHMTKYKWKSNCPLLYRGEPVDSFDERLFLNINNFSKI